MMVSEPIAQEVRRSIMQYAANYVKESSDFEQCQELLEIGDVR